MPVNSPAPSFTCRRSVTTPDLSHTSPPQPKQFNQQNKTANTSRPEICIKPFKRLFGAPCWSCDVFPSQGNCGFSCFWTLFVFIDCLETAKRGFAFFAVSRHFGLMLDLVPGTECCRREARHEKFTLLKLYHPDDPPGP